MSQQTPTVHQVPRIIVEQLGGKRFLAITGASHLVGSETSLTFSLPSTPRGFVLGGINRVRVTLDPSDTYTVEYYHVKQGFCVLVTKDTDIYNDTLQASFTRVTGLATRL